MTGKQKLVRRLGDACLKIGSGVTPRGGDATYISEGIALIRSQNVYNAEFASTGLAFIDNEQATKMSGVTVAEDDVLLNITGDSVARACIVPKDALPARVNQHVAIIRTDRAKIDPRFLMYYLVSPYMQASMLSLAGSGGTRKALTKAMVEDIDIPDLGIETQRRIASILSAYDDLIENNRRRIQLLEQSARLLYEEWFVHLRFPGHEHVRIIQGLPRNWSREPLEEVAEFRLGKMLDQEKNRGELMPYLANVNVRWGSFDLHELREMRFEHDEIETYGLKFGDIAMCEGGEPGRCAIWKGQRPQMMIQKAIHRIRCRPRITHEYLYQSLRHQGRSGQLATLFTGATIKHLPREKLAKVSVVVPPPELLKDFTDVVRPIENQIGLLKAENGRAAEARDLLLPRLMSGELAV